MREYDLLTTEPVIDEARSRQDLNKVLAGLRAERSWNRAGWARTKILEGVDAEFIHHREHADKMLHGGDDFPAAKGIRKITMRADEKAAELTIDGSREWDKKPHSYRASVKFSNYTAIRTLEGMTWPEKARMLMEDNVLVDCTCDAFRYYYRAGATKKGFALVRENRPAKVRNKRNRGTVCKHLEHALKYIGGQYAVIAGAMKRHHIEEDMTIIARIDTVLGTPAAPNAPDEIMHESRALFEGGLHEAVATFGVIDAIAGLASECSKKGMARTANALKVAFGCATVEGAYRPETVQPTDPRFLTAPKD